MKKITKNNLPSEKEKLYNIVVLILGILIILVGTLMVVTKMAGNRWGTVVEGTYAQIAGVLTILFGIYIIIKAIRNLINK